jgi:hypothetical protein
MEITEDTKMLMDLMVRMSSFTASCANGAIEGLEHQNRDLSKENQKLHNIIDNILYYCDYHNFYIPENLIYSYE